MGEGGQTKVKIPGCDVCSSSTRLCKSSVLLCWRVVCVSACVCTCTHGHVARVSHAVCANRGIRRSKSLGRGQELPVSEGQQKASVVGAW